MEDNKILDILDRLVKEAKGEVQEKHDATGVMTAQQLHGLGGVFTQLGADPDVLSTYVRPQSISNILPIFPSVDQDPRYWTLTGFTSPDGSQPTHACDDAPTGYTKGCQLTAYFGLKRFDTQEIEMDKVMLRVNRGDFKDLRFVGGPITGGTGNLWPSGITRDNALNVITAMEMLRTAVYMEMALHNDIWTGTVAGGTFPGLASQIATGQTDAATGTACPSLDSDIKDFNYNDVCGTTLDIVEYLSAMMYYLESLAGDTGLAPVKYVLAMRPQLWFELSACWPCSYLTNRCKTANVGYNALTITDSNNVAMRDDMRTRKQIPINGIWYDVVLDTGIFEHNNANNGNLAAGQFASTIYALPLTVAGNFPTLYREYVDYRQAAPDEAFLRGRNMWFNTDAGMYSWTYLERRWCYLLSLKTEQRIILRAPQLAGALQSVRYSPLQHVREPDFDSPYHVDGGISLRNSGTRYSIWFPQGGGRY